MVDLIRLDCFIELFWHYFEKWFDTDFFLCESCVDDFQIKWAGINLLDEQFLSTSLDSFYSGSHLVDVYSFSEFKGFVEEITCPYCGSSLKSNSYIWPYILTIDLGEFSEEINDIAEIAKKTPFMLLSHPFAEKIYELIKEISKETSELIFDFNLYRCRKLAETGSLYSCDELGAVPDNKATEGRFNHTGYGFLYVATTEDVSCSEVRSNEKYPVCMAEINFLKPLKILDLTDLEGCKLDNELYKTLICSSLIYNTPKSREWDRPEYVFTRFLADCALCAGFQGIKYRSRYGRKGGDNFVIFKDKTDINFQWKSIYEIERIYLKE
ncbi:hypothetical protein EO98_18995 [Methanosarcina sp. 2.H.T.1A.6]|uniref:RES family NAD+ phosphorylase n=2 Tax=Methanosarcina TaxID=2207 RepID=UPI00062264A3|nr:RES family NAD+ phosphorylase [Methanosarcina sp. 2.H.T.1A.15]KKG16571.1 hypothetical protein EO94_07350 [Methanosarcina sp. 2.H.T.1A.3]KKG19353.1 hypothetical protein EO98_18995 [Methanosarcina sp. 2.H.T.1A.6]KKG25605.1 hypothetical protein EO96_18850 [Methanosarcina sp. 2.H.T.1A.8]KKG26541.1 hypothetical protein EO97_05765 [Methanosarcina sp. 2.H.T.1A.15]